MPSAQGREFAGGAAAHLQGAAEIIRDMMQEDLLHCAVITHGGIISTMLAGFGLPKIPVQQLQCDFGEGYDIHVTATCGSGRRRLRFWA